MQNQQQENSQSSERSRSNVDRTVTLLCQKVYEEIQTFIVAASSIATCEKELELALRFADDDRDRKVKLNEDSIKASKEVQAKTISNCQALQGQLQQLGYQFRLIDSAKAKEKFSPLLHVGRVENRVPLSPLTAFCDFCDQPASSQTKFHQLCQNHLRSRA